MRNALLSLLLACVAAPAFASADLDGPRERRSERSQNADDDAGDRRSGRAERPARTERADTEDRRSAREDRRSASDDRRDAIRQQRLERRAAQNTGERVRAPAVTQHSDAPASVRNWRGRERFRENSPTVIQERNRNGAERLRQRLVQQSPPTVSRVPLQGTQPPVRSGARSVYNATQRWTDSWRSDRRYDWRGHRRRYGSLYNFGYYNDPFGWGYRPFSIGWRMWPSYYSRSHWLNDPWQYRLPYAPAGYRWIRYYDDAILVDTWDGQVVDVIRNFFW